MGFDPNQPFDIDSGAAVSTPRDKNPLSWDQRAFGVQVYKGLLDRGMKPDDALAVAANGIGESGGKAFAVNPESGASGTFQWLGARLKRYKNIFGHAPHEGNLDEHLDYLMWENQGPEAEAWRQVQNTKGGPEAKAAAFGQKWERFGDVSGEADRRSWIARHLFSSAQAATPKRGGFDPDKPFEVAKPGAKAGGFDPEKPFEVNGQVGAEQGTWDVPGKEPEPHTPPPGMKYEPYDRAASEAAAARFNGEPEPPMSGYDPVTSSGMPTADQAPNPAFARNKAYLAPGEHTYNTALPAGEEAAFRQWAAANKVPFDPDAEVSDYDMRGFWRALQAGDPRAKSAIDPNDGKPHWPDYWKTPYHETFSAQSQWANPKTAPNWNEKDQLVTPDGNVLFDDRARGQPDQPAGGYDPVTSSGMPEGGKIGLGSILPRLGPLPVGNPGDGGAYMKPSTQIDSLAAPYTQEQLASGLIEPKAVQPGGLTYPQGTQATETLETTVPGQGYVGGLLAAGNQGAVSSVGDLLSGAGDMAPAVQSRAIQRQLAAMDLVDQGAIPEAMKPLAEVERGFLSQYINAPPEQRLEQRAALLATADKVGQRTPNLLNRAGTAVSEFGTNAFPVAKENEGFGTNVARTLGGIGPLVGAGAVAGAVGGPGAAIAVTLPMIGAQSFHHTLQEAVDKGASRPDAERAAGINALTQMGIMALPIGRVVAAAPEMAAPLAKVLVDIGKRGAEFATFNGLARVADNFIAQNTYDPKRELTDGVAEAAAVGAVSGAAMGAPGALRGLARPGPEGLNVTPKSFGDQEREAREAMSRAADRYWPGEPPLGLPAPGVMTPEAAAMDEAAPVMPPRPAPFNPSRGSAPVPEMPVAPGGLPPGPMAELNNIAAGDETPSAPTIPTPPVETPTPQPAPTSPVIPMPAPAAQTPRPKTSREDAEDASDMLLKRPLPNGWELGVDPAHPDGWTVFDHEDRPVARAPTATEALKAAYAASADEPFFLPTISPEPAEQAATHPGYVMLDPRQLRLDPGRFQFKDADERGVTGALRGTKRWEPALANPITVWQGDDGGLYVVNGHQRTDLALRAQAEGQEDVQVPTRVYREADGYTPEYMRLLGAYQNIAEGTGTAVDAAKILRGAGTLPEEMRLPDLPPRSAMVQQARGLAQLSNDAFGVVANGIVPPEQAAHVGTLISDPTEQMAALDLLARTQPPNAEQARLMVEDIRHSGFLKGAQTSLFGEEQITQSLIPERARVLDHAMRALRRAKGVYQSAVSGEDILASSGNVLNAEGNIAGKTENERLLETIRRNAVTRGPLSDALSDAARSIASGTPIGAASSRFLTRVREIERRGEGEGLSAGPDAGGGRPAAEVKPGTDLLGAPIKEPTTKPAEPTIKNDARQTLIPGTGPSAVQAQAAQDQKGKNGALQPTVEQAKPDEGLFAKPEAEQPSLPVPTEAAKPEAPKLGGGVTAFEATLSGTPEHPGIRLKNLRDGKETVIQPPGTTRPEPEANPNPEQPKAEPPKEEPKAEERPSDYGADNKTFTAEAAEKARARLREMLGGLNAGFNPELMLHGMTLAGFHIEAGARKFADYAKRMVGELGEGIRPYLAHLYHSVREYPGFDAKGMDDRAAVDKELQRQAEKPISPDQEAENGVGPVGDHLDQPGGGETSPGGRPSGEPEGTRPPAVLETKPPEDVSGPDGGKPRGENGPGAGPQTLSGTGGVHPGGVGADGRPGAGDEGVAPDGAGDRNGEHVPVPAPVRPNFHIDDPERIAGGTPKVRFSHNREAIEAYKAIEAEQRPPTQAELETLAGYTGWGSFGQELFDGTWNRPKPKPEWKTEDQWLREHLGKDEWESAQRSIENAHYTDPPTVQAMWDMAQNMGFRGGRILEPSLGIGNFFGLMPREIMNQSSLTGIELDKLTGGMAKLLYPHAAVSIKGYQDSQTPDGFYDLVIGNWPFAAQSPADRRYDRLSPTLHDYFFLKALDQTRPGGLVIGITSAGTMDKAGRAARLEMAHKGELLAAFRLPSGAFEKYAGTKVVTDILVFRKLAQPPVNPSSLPWVTSLPMQVPNGEVRVNNYYHEHPDHVLGEIDYGHGTTTFRPGMIVHRPTDLMDRLKALPARMPTDGYEPTIRGNEPRFVANNTTDRQNNIVIGDDKNLYQVKGERLMRLSDLHRPMAGGTAKAVKAREEQVRKLVGLRKAYGELIDAEREGRPETESLRQVLANQYEHFLGDHGAIGASEGLRVLDKVDDPAYPLLRALERPDGSPSRILTAPTVRARRSLKNPTVSDAYIMARNEQAHFDMDRVAALANVPKEFAEQTLLDSGAVLRTPGGGFQPRDVYLSGNVRRKLREAREALQTDPLMQHSVDALTERLPPTVPYHKIDINLGATWVAEPIYDRFVGELLGLSNPEDFKDIHVRFAGSRWKVTFTGNFNNRPEATTINGSPWYAFNKLLGAAMGNQSVRIEDPADRDGGPYFNQAKTDEVNEKIALVREKFQDWAWANPERKVALEKAFNEQMNAIAKTKFDGSFMDMSGMALLRGDDPFSLREHQLAAIWRGIIQQGGLFAHEVGTGKAAPLDTRLLTPDGWVLMGDIRVGDLVITQSGASTKVEAIFPQGMKQIFRVTFSDGASTECCDEHLWLTQTYRERIAAINQARLGKDWPSAKAKVRSLAEIRDTLVAPHLGAKNHSIPLVDPVMFNERPVPLDPYFLGALLGDGHFARSVVSFSKPDAEMIPTFVLPDGVEARRLSCDNKCPTWHFVGIHRGHNPLPGIIRDLGLAGHNAAAKFVPDIYKFNTPDVRVAVLRGLMDTDGFVNRKGTSVAISTASVRLADDITFLVRSLGGIAKRTTKQPSYTYKGQKLAGQPAFILSITMPPEINPFQLSRKADKVVAKTKYVPARYIVSAEPVGEKPAQCIRVSDPSHLYVTDDFIVTHNTYTMAGIAVEGRRYGVHRKPLIIAHNANSGSVAREAQDMYPGAKFLYIDNLDPANVKTSMHRIANEDWDAVILPHSVINKLTLTRETLNELAAEQIAALENEAIEAAREEAGIDLTPEMMDDTESKAFKRMRSPTAKDLVRQRNAIKTNIDKQANRASKEGAVSFEHLGIDAILVDEAHEFNKPPIATRMKLKGLNTRSSDRSIALNFLTGYVAKQRNGRGIYLFTGTPILNAMNEAYNMSRYFMSDRLKEGGIDQWDAWFNSFARADTNPELTPGGNYAPSTRLTSWQNPNELARIMSEFTDVVQAKDMPEFVDRATPSGKTLKSPDLTPEERDFLENGISEKPIGRPYKRVIQDVGEMSPAQARITEHIGRLDQEWRSADGKQKREWMQTGDEHSPIIYGQNLPKASMDARLYDPDAPEDPNSKSNRVARNVSQIYHSDPKAAQVIFVDSGYQAGVSAKGAEAPFILVNDLVDKLVASGIPRNQIAVARGGMSAEKKKELADKMNDGRLRVAIGLSNTLGVGVNMQTYLRAMHHMDAPYRPGDLEQRDGRGHRQGNKYNTVLEYRYLTEGMDGNRWQILARKQKFITDFIAAIRDDTGKRLENLDGDAAGLGEDEDILQTLATAAGDPRIMVREQLKVDINRLQKRERNHEYGRSDAAELIRMREGDIKYRRAQGKIYQDEADLWRGAVERSAAAAKEAKDTHRWYEAVIGGKPLRTGDEITAAIDAAIHELTPGQKGVKIGNINGVDLLVVDWHRVPLKDEMAPDFALARPGHDPIGRISSPALQIISRMMNDRQGFADMEREKLKEAEQSLPALRQAVTEEFPQKETLAKKRQQLATLEADIDSNPIPPPAWLRNGAPIGTDIHVDGEKRVVRGHRMDTDYKLITDEGEVPYLEAKDENGLPMFEPHAPPDGAPAPEPPVRATGWNAPVRAGLSFETGHPSENAQFSESPKGWGVGETATDMPSMDAVKAAADAVHAMLGGNIHVGVVDGGLRVEDGHKPARFVGGYALGRVIRVALDQHTLQNLDHEAIHALKNLGVFTPREWELLEAAAKREGWIDKHNIEPRYGHLPEDKQIEEAIAERFARGPRTESKTSLVGRMLDKLRQWMARLRLALGREGFKTVEDVFGAIRRGDIGKREPGSKSEQRGPRTIEESREAAKMLHPDDVSFSLTDAEKAAFSRSGVGGDAPLRGGLERSRSGVIRRGADAMINRLRLQQNLDMSRDLNDRRSVMGNDELREIEDFINYVGEHMFEDVGLRVMKDGAGANGAYESGRRIVYLFRKAIDDGTASWTMIHELWHAMERTLPAADRAAVIGEFRRQQEKWLRKNPWARPFLEGGELRDRLRGREARAWTEAHGQDPNAGRLVETNGDSGGTVSMVWTQENYRFKNASEYFAETMSDRHFDAQDILNHRARSVFGHIRGLWRRAVDGLKRLFGRDASGRIYEGFGRREYDPGVDNGLLAERDFAESRIGDAGKAILKPLRDVAKTVMERPTAAKARDAITEFIAPMRMGSKEAAEQAFTFANRIRQGQYEFGNLASHIREKFSIPERWEMGRAQAEQSVFERKLARDLEALPTADRAAYETKARRRFDATGQGHAGLDPDQHAIVETLSDMADQTWKAYQARDMVDKDAEGWAHWMPRQLVIMDPKGKARRIVKDDSLFPSSGRSRSMPGAPDMHPFGTNLRTEGPGFRDYEEVEATLEAARKKFGPNVVLVNDVLSLVGGLERANAAITGHDLLQGIKSYGARTGLTTAYEGGGQLPGFTLAGHPSMWRWRPKFVTDEDGKTVVATAPDGRPIFEKVPMWVHSDFRAPLDAVFRAPRGNLMKAFMGLKAISTHFVMQSPLIHLEVELGRAMPLLAGRTPVVLTLAAGRRARMGHDPRIRELLRHGMAPITRGFIGDPAELMNEANYMPPLGAVGRTVTRARDALARGASKLPAGEFLEKVLRRPIQTLLWNRVLDLQVAIGLGMAEDRIRAGWPPEAAYTAGAHLANRYAGALPPEGMSRLMNTLANVFLFSRSFTGGNIGVMKDVFTGAPKHVLDHIEATAGPETRQAAEDWLKHKAKVTFVADIILFYALTTLIQEAARAVFGDDSQESASEGYVRRFHEATKYVTDHPVKSIFVPNVIARLLPTADNEPGKEDRSRLWRLGNTEQWLYARTPAGKVGEDFLAWITDPFSTALRKQSTITKGVEETVTGKDSFGRDIRRPGKEDDAANIWRSTVHMLGSLFPTQLESDAYTALGRPGSSLWGAPPPTDKERKLAGLQVLGSLTGLASISRGHPNGPIAGAESVKERQIKFDIDRVMPEVRRLAASGRRDDAKEKLIKVGEDPLRAERRVNAMVPENERDQQTMAATRMQNRMSKRGDQGQIDRSEVLRRSYGLE